MKILRRIRVAHSIPFLLFAALLGAQAQSPQAGGSKNVPDTAMMAPVTSTCKLHRALGWRGSTQCSWTMDSFSSRTRAFILAARMRRHSGMPVFDTMPYHSGDLKFTFGPAHAFERTWSSGSILVLPTTWHGLFKTGNLKSTARGTFVSRLRLDNGGLMLTGGGQQLAGLATDTK